MFRSRPLRHLTTKLLFSQPRGYYFSDTRPILPTAVDVTSDEYKVHKKIYLVSKLIFCCLVAIQSNERLGG